MMTQKSCYQAKQHLCAKTRSQLCVLAHNSILPCHVCWTSHGTRDSLISYDQLDSFLAFHGPRKEAAEKNIYCKENKLWTPPKAKDIMREASKKRTLLQRPLRVGASAHARTSLRLIFFCR
jgi:hypothetical protein